MAAETIPLVSPDEYLALDRRAEVRSEYLSGQLFAMLGAGRAQVDIVGNLDYELRKRLEGTGCRPAMNDMRVRVTPTGPFLYPDVLTYCQDAIWTDDEFDTLTNPLAIFEVLSRSTEARDRGEKLHHYRRLASVADIVLVSQEAIRLEHYARNGDAWVFMDILDPESHLRLRRLEVDLPVADIYRDVVFKPALTLSDDE